MSAASDNTRYLREVQALVLRLRGGGLTLSPLDVDRIRAWRDGGVPLDLALAGVRAAHAAWAAGGNRMRPFQLRLAERHVAELAAGWERRGGALAAAPAPPPAAPASAAGGPLPRLIARLESRRAGAPAAGRAAYAATLSWLAPRAGSTANLDRILLAADEVQALAWLRALPRPEQRRIASACRDEAGPRSGVPRRAYRAMLRSHLCEAAYERGGLLRPSDLT